jgi:hypothetical protein
VVRIHAGSQTFDCSNSLNYVDGFQVGNTRKRAVFLRFRHSPGRYGMPTAEVSGAPGRYRKPTAEVSGAGSCRFRRFSRVSLVHASRKLTALSRNIRRHPHDASPGRYRKPTAEVSGAVTDNKGHFWMEQNTDKASLRPATRTPKQHRVRPAQALPISQYPARIRLMVRFTPPKRRRRSFCRLPRPVFKTIDRSPYVPKILPSMTRRSVACARTSKGTVQSRTEAKAKDK